MLKGVKGVKPRGVKPSNRKSYIPHVKGLYRYDRYSHVHLMFVVARLWSLVGHPMMMYLNLVATGVWGRPEFVYSDFLLHEDVHFHESRVA